MYETKFTNTFLWIGFTIGLMIANILWGILSIYRFYFVEGPENYMGIIWFFTIYGAFIFCAYIAMLFIGVPKRIMDHMSYLTLRKALAIPKLCIISSLLYLLNNFALAFESVSAYNDVQNYTRGVLGYICIISFFGCWMLINICCILIIQILKDRERNRNIMLNSQQIELRRIII